MRALTFVAVAISFWGLRDLVLGNAGVLLLPMAVAWRWLDRPLCSVALAATISIWPSIGALLLWQLLRRKWRVAAWTIGAGVELTIASGLLVGVDGYRDYFSVLGNMVVPGHWSENRDLGATLVRLGLDARCSPIAGTRPSCSCWSRRGYRRPRPSCPCGSRSSCCSSCLRAPSQRATAQWGLPA